MDFDNNEADIKGPVERSGEPLLPPKPHWTDTNLPGVIKVAIHVNPDLNPSTRNIVIVFGTYSDRLAPQTSDSTVIESDSFEVLF